jgi:hypothetical protein
MFGSANAASPGKKSDVDITMPVDDGFENLPPVALLSRGRRTGGNRTRDGSRCIRSGRVKATWFAEVVSTSVSSLPTRLEAENVVEFAIGGQAGIRRTRSAMKL